MQRREQGWTFLDLVLCLVIVAFVAGYAVMKLNKTGVNTLWFQGNKLARDIRHVQAMSSTYGKTLALVATTSGYSVACVAGVPCDSTSTYVMEPVTGDSFSVTFQNGVALSSGATITFDNMGRPLSGGSITTSTSTLSLGADGTTMTVAVAPITGFVSTTP